MTEFLVFVLFIICAMQYRKLRRVRRDVDELRSENRQIEKLTARVYALECAAPHVPEPPTAPLVQRVAIAEEPPPPIVEPQPEPTHQAPPSLPEPEPMPPPPVEPPPPPVPAGPSWRERIASGVASQEWEAMVGGNWLNKLGVLILIIGIALLLGYSFTKVGPAGRVAIALAVSGGMLAAGVAVERRSVYRVFARGLIGGGWAGLYFTAYAMYAVDAARIIANPWIASILLTAVAAGMILHSLKYKSQTVTGLAYFIAFATLVITPVNTFSFVALVPLTASLLYLAHRFEWFEMALFGVFATYGACIARGDSGSPLASSQAIIGVYWLLFEGFTILRASKPKAFSLPERCIFPLNTVGVLALSVPKWNHVARHHSWAFLAACAVVFIAGAAARYRLRRPDEATPLPERMANGGYEGPITIAAGLATGAVWLKATTVWINFGWLVEAELLFLAGRWLGQAYPQRLSAALFGLATLKLAAQDAPANSHEWWPVGLFSTALMYLNRWLRRTAKYFSYGAAIPLLLVAGYESPALWVGAAWFLIGLALFEFGLRKSLVEYRLQAYGFVVFALCALAINDFGAPLTAKLRWAPVLVAVAAAYVMALRAKRIPEGVEARYAPVALAWAATFSAVLFVWLAAPTKFIGTAWIALALLMLELGLRIPNCFRWQSYPVASIGWAYVLVTVVIDVNKGMGTATRLALGGAALLSYALCARGFRTEAYHRVAASLAGTAFAATLMWMALPDPVVAVGWALLGIALMQFTGPNTRVLTVQADLMGAATFGRLFFANFVNTGSTGGVSHRLLTVAPVIASEYYAWFERRQSKVGRLYLYAAPILAVILLRFELGRVLTVVGWAAFTLLLYWIGRKRDDLDFRLQSYALALICFWRSWTTNFYVPESFAGVPGRVATGAFVVIALYIAQALAPRASDARLKLDRYARQLFSVLASALVALMLYYEVSGAVLTVAWGVQAALLMAAGFWARDRVLRLSGLLLLLNCILKLFFYDLRHLDTISRIFSFIVLGAVMVGVSWVYTRFRKQIERYL